VFVRVLLDKGINGSGLVDAAVEWGLDCQNVMGRYYHVKEYLWNLLLGAFIGIVCSDVLCLNSGC
jgi:hypothetical protein